MSQPQNANSRSDTPAHPLSLGELASLGLDPERIGVHAQRIQSALKLQSQTTLDIAAPCSISNGGIVPAELLVHLGLDENQFSAWAQDHLVTLIPAGGEASRFTQDIIRFVKDHAETLEAIAQGNSPCPDIPPLLNKLSDFVRNVTFPGIRQCFLERRDALEQQQGNHLPKSAHWSRADKALLPVFLDAYASAQALLDVLGSRPKALVPAVIEGSTFLELKLREQKQLLPGSACAVVAPAGKVTEFSDHLAQLKADNWLILEQSRTLSTIRFHTDGWPVHDECGSVVPVAGGHGELLHLFPSLINRWPQARCVHIRNIDNVIGTQAEVQQEISRLGAFFQTLLSALDAARHALEAYGDLEGLPTALASALAPLMGTKEPGLCLGAVLYTRLQPLFSWPKLPEHLYSPTLPQDSKALNDLLKKHLAKPLSVFGVVPKKQGDVGGGPVFIYEPLKGGEGHVAQEHRQTIKICLEMPHASSAQRQEYFGEQGLCSHFNPVCSFFELQNQGVSQLFDDRFWLLTRRPYQGGEVCYHETVLYELIGNSAQTNLVFVEISRQLFNPHKTIFDGMGASLQDRGF